MSPPAEPPLLTSSRGVTLIGGGPVDRATLDLALAHAPRLVAADSGADRAAALGAEPELVVGDLDSLSPALRSRLRAVKVAEQESTDFEKAITRIDAPFALGVGFLGGRLDHSLASLAALIRAPRPAVLIGEQDLAFLAPQTLALDLPVGTRFSLFPLGPVAGRGTGLVWPINDLCFAPGGRIGTSNAVEGPVRLVFDAAAMLAILPRAHLAAVLAAIARPPP